MILLSYLYTLKELFIYPKRSYNYKQMKNMNVIILLNLMKLLDTIVDKNIIGAPKMLNNF